MIVAVLAAMLFPAFLGSIRHLACAIRPYDQGKNGSMFFGGYPYRQQEPPDYMRNPHASSGSHAYWVNAEPIMRAYKSHIKTEIR